MAEDRFLTLARQSYEYWQRQNGWHGISIYGQVDNGRATIQMWWPTLKQPETEVVANYDIISLTELLTIIGRLHRKCMRQLVDAQALDIADYQQPVDEALQEATIKLEASPRPHIGPPQMERILKK